MTDRNSPPIDHNTQCMLVTEALNLLDPNINQIFSIREITPEDELIDDELVFTTQAVYQTYLSLRNEMDYYGGKRDEFVKRQNFELASHYLDKLKRSKMILHRGMQTLSFKSGKRFAATRGNCIVYFNPKIQG